MSTQATETGAVRRSITVDCPVEHAFSTFTDRIHEWWPLETHSIEVDEGGSKPETVIFDGPGGRLYERTTKGEGLEWARVMALTAPPVRARVEPQPSGTASHGDRGHVHRRGRQDARRPRAPRRANLGGDGGEVRQGYDSAWAGVLAGYGETASS